MGNFIIKDHVDSLKPHEGFFRDPIGPIKLEAIDFVLRNFAEQIGNRLEAIENHLEKGQGTPFIRVQERPDVGGAALQDLTQNLRKLNERLDRLESRIK
jgi:hypothetical protein